MNGITPELVSATVRRILQPGKAVQDPALLSFTQVNPG
jgi:hypothetical protein